MKKYLPWAVAAAAVAFYVLNRRASGADAAAAAAAVNGGRPRGDIGQLGESAKSATDIAIQNAINSANAIRKDPGIAALLGLGQQDIDRIVLKPQAYAELYQRTDNSGSTSPIVQPGRMDPFLKALNF